MGKLLMAMTIILAVLVATIAESSAQTINGCVNNKTGILRIGTSCTKSETPISWNQVGPQGPQGPPGPTGPTGGLNYQRIALQRWYDYDYLI